MFADRLEVGRIGAPHGLAGEVVLHFTSDRGERRQPGTVLHAGERTLVVTAARPHGRRWLVRFEGVDDRDAAEALRGAVLTAPPLGPLPEGEEWVHELIGATVVDPAGTEHGTVRAIEANPAHDLLVLDDDRLVPMPFVVEVRPGLVVVDPPAGLLEDPDG